MIRYITTPTFKLAVYASGNENADKLALILPGLLDTKDYRHMRSHVDFLATKGYLAISFDPPGTWESPGDIKLYNMTNYLKAINELIEYFGNKPTFVMGHSRGGSMAMLAAITNPKVVAFASVMSNYSFTPTGELTPQQKEWKAKGYKTEWRDLPPGSLKKEKSFDLPFGFYKDQCQYNMLDGLRKCAKPKLFILGKTDTTCPPETVKYECQESAEPKELYELNCDHNYRHHPDLIDEVNQVIGKFLDHHNKIKGDIV